MRRVVRADSVRQLTDEGWKALVDYGIRTVVDLRGGPGAGRTIRPPSFRVEVVARPVHGDDERSGRVFEEVEARPKRRPTPRRRRATST